MLELQADEKNGDGCRAGDEPAGQAKHHNLSGGDVLASEAPVNILRVGALVSVLPLVINQRMFVVVIMLVVMVMVMVVVVMMVVMMRIVRLALFPGPLCHPQGDQDDQDSRDQLEPRL